MYEFQRLGFGSVVDVSVILDLVKSLYYKISRITYTVHLCIKIVMIRYLKSQHIGYFKIFNIKIYVGSAKNILFQINENVKHVSCVPIYKLYVKNIKCFCLRLRLQCVTFVLRKSLLIQIRNLQINQIFILITTDHHEYRMGGYKAAIAL